MKDFWKRTGTTKTFRVGMLFIIVGVAAVVLGQPIGAAVALYGLKVITGRDTQAKEQELQEAILNELLKVAKEKAEEKKED